MTTRRWLGGVALAGLLAIPGFAEARGLSVELWTDRGNDAVYQPGDPIQIKARTSDDAYLLVYEIDAEGSVHLLFPTEGGVASVEGRRTYRLPGDDDRNDLVVDAQTGEGYIVAIASAAPFEDLPWYLRPYNDQAEEIGFVGKPDDEEGITAEGRIVGDPFVAMERIRRRVLRDASDADDFGTAYCNYYVHERVRYPRYICNDCHRPGRYAWWDGWDPYYTTCSVFDFRVNWSWGWGPRYWFGDVPYFVYVYRPDCPPHYRSYYTSGYRYSSWDGWNRWCQLWGDNGLRRYKSSPPPNYIPPSRYREAARIGRPIRQLPPGFIAANEDRRYRTRGGSGGGGGIVTRDDRRSPTMPRVGDRPRRDEGSDVRPRREDGRDRGATTDDRPRRGDGGGLSRPPKESSPPPREERGRGNSDQPRREWRPAPPREEPRQEPRQERGKDESRKDEPRKDEPRKEEPRRSRWGISLSPRDVGGSSYREQPRFEPRAEARSEWRPAPQQVEAPRFENREAPQPRETPRYEAPRSEPPREAPRVEAPRVEAPRVEAPRVERPEPPRPEARREEAPREQRGGGNREGRGGGRWNR